MKLRRGFSLIEIGIVMIIIGILIAAVMKGKDVIRSAEMKQYNQTFFNKWVGVATSHFDKVGYNITGTGTDGSMTTGDGRVADDSLTDGNNTIGCTNIKAAVARAGINLDNLIPADAGNACQKTITGEFTGNILVSVGFENLTLITEEENATARNVVLFFNVPGDIALGFDRLVDGIANPSAGKVIILQVSDSTSSTRLDNDNLGFDDNNVTTISGDINATQYHTVGVILEH
ncbi:MAG: prepilin-type N-terminal cleavage/methylation domain-containing protein [Arcobacteraceae bacterium]|nr:prepilin-type N-terminal cleavage/methylation domain-containing protein [Arcobacteraceae bacterium]